MLLARTAESVRGGPASVWLWPIAISAGSGRAQRAPYLTSGAPGVTAACGPIAEREGATAGGVEESPLGQELFGHVQNAESHAFGDRLVMRIPQEHVE